MRVAQAMHGAPFNPGGPECRLEEAGPEGAGIDVRVALLHRLATFKSTAGRSLPGRMLAGCRWCLARGA